MKAARFPAYKDLPGFIFPASEANETLVHQLHCCEVMDAAENAVMIRGPGTGKSHVTTAIGIQAIEHPRKRVRFFSTVELVNVLEQEKAQGKVGKIAEMLVKTDLSWCCPLAHAGMRCWGIDEPGEAKREKRDIIPCYSSGTLGADLIKALSPKAAN